MPTISRFLLFHRHRSIQISSLVKRCIPSIPSTITRDPRTFFTRSSSSSSCSSLLVLERDSDSDNCFVSSSPIKTSIKNFSSLPPSSSLVVGRRWFPHIVTNIGELIRRSMRYRHNPVCTDERHWLVEVFLCRNAYESEEEMFNEYVRAVAEVLGSKEEAKKSIYVVCTGKNERDRQIKYGFGVEMDINTTDALRDVSCVACITQDYLYDVRKMTPTVQFASSFIPFNSHHRLDNLYSYHYLSNRNSKWNYDHWVVNIKQPFEGANVMQINDICIQMLAEIIGSEEAAMEKIYVVWYFSPFGFAVETDEETADKLRGLPGVLKVLPDYAFDTKEKPLGYYDPVVLEISPRYKGSRFSQYRLTKESDSEDWLLCMKELNGETGVSFSFVKVDHNLNNNDREYIWRSDCKHWFIKLEKPYGEDASIQQRIDYCTKTLESAIKREEAAMKIYRIRCERHFLGFGMKMDVEVANMITGMHGVVEVLPDYNVTSVPQSSPLNLNDRLTDIFSYYHLSEFNSEVNVNHWLIHIKQPCDGFATEKETIEFCVQVLAEVLGSSVEDARKKIYIAVRFWC